MYSEGQNVAEGKIKDIQNYYFIQKMEITKDKIRFQKKIYSFAFYWFVRG